MSANQRMSTEGRNAAHPYGEYSKGTWETGDIIEKYDLNTIEDGIYYIDREIRQARDNKSSLLEKINTIDWRIGDLEYTPIEISTFEITSPSRGIAEKGSTINSLGLSWSFNKGVPTNLTLNGSSITPPETTSKTLTNLNLNTNTTYTLIVKDSGSHSHSINTATKTVQLKFYNNIYYGAATIPTAINSLFITGLQNKTLSDTKEGNFSVTANNGQYIWYALPTRLGKANFNVGGFDGGFEKEQIVSVTNASGYTENYYIYRSTNPNLGNTTVTVKGGA